MHPNEADSLFLFCGGLERGKYFCLDSRDDDDEFYHIFVLKSHFFMANRT